MFFRPTFCANCGEKIERTDWGIFTSRRFCQVCESEFKGHDLIPRFLVVAGVVVGIFGLGSYLRSGTSAGPMAARVEHVPPEQKVVAQPVIEKPVVGSPESGNSNNAINGAPRPRPFASNIGRDAVSDVNASENVYFCGARTKKGTPCSRRVKGNVRCFQHIGVPAMLPAEQLRIK